MRRFDMKRLITALAMMAFLVSMSMMAFANDGTVTKYTTTSVSAYALPRADSTVLATLPAGTSVVTYPGKAQNGFEECFTNSTHFCYIASVFLTTTPGGGPSPSPSPYSGTEKVVSGVSNYLALRSAAATSESNEIGKLYNGEKFYVTQYVNGFAYGETSYHKWGYVNASYLKDSGSSGGTTYYQGYDWSPVYNYDYYKAVYPDVVAALGTDPQSLIAHFVNHGIYEGRQGRADWNVYTYMNQHPELYAKYGNNISLYYMHAVGKI